MMPALNSHGALSRPRRQYEMEKVGKRAPGGSPPAPAAPTPRAGRSGEGARSALERLIEQERTRAAQRPREGDRPADRKPGA